MDFSLNSSHCQMRWTPSWKRHWLVLLLTLTKVLKLLLRCFGFLFVEVFLDLPGSYRDVLILRNSRSHTFPVLSNCSTKIGCYFTQIFEDHLQKMKQSLQVQPNFSSLDTSTVEQLAFLSCSKFFLAPSSDDRHEALCDIAVSFKFVD